MDASQLLRRALASQLQLQQQQLQHPYEEHPSLSSSSANPQQQQSQWSQQPQRELDAVKEKLSASVDELSISGHKHLLTKVALLRMKMREFTTAVESDDRSNIAAAAAALSERTGSIADREADQERELLLSYILDDKKKATTLNEELQRSSYDLQIAHSKLRQLGHKLGVMEDLYIKEKASGARLSEALDKAQNSFGEIQSLKYQLDVALLDRGSLQQQVQELIDKTNNLEYELRQREKHAEDVPSLRSDLRARDHELSLLKAERAEWRRERMQLVLQGDQLRTADANLSELNLSLAAYSKTAALQPPHIWAEIPQLHQASPQLHQRVQSLLADLHLAQSGFAKVLQENVFMQHELSSAREAFTEGMEGLRNDLRASNAAAAAATDSAERAAQRLLAAGVHEDASFLLERVAELMASYQPCGPTADVAIHARNQKVIAGVQSLLDNWSTIYSPPAINSFSGSRPLHLLSSGQSANESALLRLNVMEATNLAEKQNQLASMLEGRLQQVLQDLRSRDAEIAALRAADTAARGACERAAELRLRDGSLRFRSLPSDFKLLSTQRQLESLLGLEATGPEGGAYRAKVREITDQLQLSRIGSPDRQQHALFSSFSFDAPSPLSPAPAVRSSHTTRGAATAGGGLGLLQAKASLSTLKEARVRVI